MKAANPHVTAKMEAKQKKWCVKKMVREEEVHA
jgi:hypothetical protein